MKKYWDQIEVGDKLQGLTKTPISRLQIAQFAAASNEFSPLNLDDEFAKNAGFGSVYAQGLMSLGFVEESLKAFAVNMKILSLSGTFQRLIWPGDLLTPKGFITRRYQKNHEFRAQFTLWCENQNKEVIMRGASVCLLFKNAEHEQQTNSSWPNISSLTRETLNNRLNQMDGLNSSLEKTRPKKELV